MSGKLYVYKSAVSFYYIRHITCLSPVSVCCAIVYLRARIFSLTRRTVIVRVISNRRRLTSASSCANVSSNLCTYGNTPKCIYLIKDMSVARASCSHIEDNCKWSSIPRVRGELAENKSTSYRLQGGYAINHQGSGPGRPGSRGVCLTWLSYPLINRKHLWHQPPKCHYSCCHAELRKSDLEVTARHLNEVEAVQHVHLTNIPVWFGLLDDV